ncbi:MAG: hypothetical protein ABIV28_02695 [Longimicrobiales bacterium]
MTIPRREFLGIAGATGLLAATGNPLSAEAPERPLTNGERHPAPVSATWDMGWVDKVNGKQRAIFDSPGVSDGAALFRAVMWMNQHKEVYGTPRTDMSAVVVFRHEGIVLAMKSEYWKTYKVGKEMKMKDEKGKDVVKNPIEGPTDGAESKSPYNIPGFIAAGGIVLACNLAFGGLVAEVRQKEKLTREQADAKVRALLIPGVQLMPSGVFAALRAQEAGCNYIIGS